MEPDDTTTTTTTTFSATFEDLPADPGEMAHLLLKLPEKFARIAGRAAGCVCAASEDDDVVRDHNGNVVGRLNVHPGYPPVEHILGHLVALAVCPTCGHETPADLLYLITSQHDAEGDASEPGVLVQGRPETVVVRCGECNEGFFLRCTVQGGALTAANDRDVVVDLVALSSLYRRVVIGATVWIDGHEIELGEWRGGLGYILDGEPLKSIPLAMVGAWAAGLP